MVLMRDNIDELADLVDLAAALGVDSVGAVHLTVFEDALDAQSLRHDPRRSDRAFAHARARAHAHGIQLDLPPDMDGTRHPAPHWTIALRDRWKALGRIGRTSTARMVRLLRNHIAVRRWEHATGGAVGCNYLTHRTYISVGGDVTPCCMPGRPVMGNLHEQSFEAIWNGPTYTAMRRGMQTGQPFACCAHCSVNRRAGYRPTDEHTVRPPEAQRASPATAAR